MAVDAPMQKLGQLPPEMLEFTLLKTTGALGPRLGRLSLPGRKHILTPDFIGNTSRGVIPHVSQDNFGKSVDLGGVYVALEDCMYHARYDIVDIALTPCSRRETSAEDTADLQV
jgi:queuine tRNA-ribosyltransferase